ncbi:unnamed protein product [Paramecium primaurelia]|uniref:Uncharacterized protein n=1 Tax=Paramecium primaurelia TaxID=5886 RepID=A0A8S1N583_PARPR|nr:unnamed protein product [Paramecium primaurelia]
MIQIIYRKQKYSVNSTNDEYIYHQIFINQILFFNSCINRFIITNFQKKKPQISFQSQSSTIYTNNYSELNKNSLNEFHNHYHFWLIQQIIIFLQIFYISQKQLKNRMNPQIKNTLNCLDQTLSQYGTVDLEVNKWDQIQQRLVKVKIQLTITQDNQIICLYEGVILKKQVIIYMFQSQIIQDNYLNPEVLNLEQIKHLQWQGEYCQNKRKFGKWIAIWNGEALLEVGGYYESGLKQGLWKELINQYWSHATIYQSGDYFNDQKQGIWTYNYNNEKIGGGSYNSQGQKDGKWIELKDRFYNESQVTYSGVYKNGKKVSIWETKYEHKQIGGGSYDYGDEGIKVGRWIELSDGFYKYSQVTYNGEYKSGKKVGRWDIKCEGKLMQPYDMLKFSGGGSYNNGGDEFKIGRWIELSDGFRWNSQISFEGEYINNTKIGRWNIFGGGFYDEDGNGFKIGRWIELSDEFWSGSQVTYNGEYKNGKKVGRWEIQHESKKIGGGFYDEEGYGIKIGRWIELNDEFWSSSQVTYNGEYKNGRKVGRWEIYQKKGNRDQKKEYIGGGQYDERANGIKIGRWIELNDGFYDYSQVIHYGEYQNGTKIGRWQIQYEGKQMQIFLIIILQMSQWWWII